MVRISYYQRYFAIELFLKISIIFLRCFIITGNDHICVINNLHRTILKKSTELHVLVGIFNFQLSVFTTSSVCTKSRGIGRIIFTSASPSRDPGGKQKLGEWHRAEFSSGRIDSISLNHGEKPNKPPDRRGWMGVVVVV